MPFASPAASLSDREAPSPAANWQIQPHTNEPHAQHTILARASVASARTVESLKTRTNVVSPTNAKMGVAITIAHNIR